MSKFLINLLITVIVATGAAWAFQKYNTPRTAYVKSQAILQGYKEMSVVSAQFDSELKIVKANLDTLQARYEKLKAQEAIVPAKDKGEWAYRAEVALGEFQKYDQQVAEQMQARRDELTQKALGSVNDFIQKYGKENNYSLILGTTDDGSILYGVEQDDLTQVILTKLNEEYEAKSSAPTK